MSEKKINVINWLSDHITGDIRARISIVEDNGSVLVYDYTFRGLSYKLMWSIQTNQIYSFDTLRALQKYEIDRELVSPKPQQTQLNLFKRRAPLPSRFEVP